jgi:hypothetical protein
MLNSGVILFKLTQKELSFNIHIDFNPELLFFNSPSQLQEQIEFGIIFNDLHLHKSKFLQY